MGRATIVSGGEDGRYTISVDLGSAAKTALIEKLTSRIAVKTEQIVKAESALAAAEETAIPARVELGVTTNAYIAAVTASGDMGSAKTELAAMEAARKALGPLEAAVQAKRLDVAELKAAKISYQKQLNATQSIVVTLTQQAWCADLTEDATGEVATIEIPGEQNLILIQAAAPAPASGDGRLVARELQSPEQVFWNAAALPGWQKWRPMYRTGIISNISNELDTCDVALDAATSSAQNLGVNRVDSLTEVPIVYMTCNADAFEEGDHVVVRYAGATWDSITPVVIGFVTDPKECVPWPLYVRVPVHAVDDEVIPGVGTRARVFTYGLDPWGCGIEQAYTYDENLPVCQSATVNIKIMEPVGRLPDLIEGMDITGVTTGTIWTREATAFGQSRFYEPFGRCPSMDGANDVRVDAELVGVGTISASDVVYNETELTLPIAVSGACVATGVMDFVYFTISGSELIPPQPVSTFVAANGGMPNVAITYGSRTKQYEFLENAIDDEATGGPFFSMAKLVMIYQRVDD